MTGDEFVKNLRDGVAIQLQAFLGNNPSAGQTPIPGSSFNLNDVTTHLRSGSDLGNYLLVEIIASTVVETLVGVDP